MPNHIRTFVSLRDNCFVKAVLYAISCVENDRMQDKADLRAFYSGNFKEPVIGSVRHLSEIVDKKVKDEDVADI